MDSLEKERVVKNNVLEIFKENFLTHASDSEILRIRPEREFDTDFIAYYEDILEMFLIERSELNKITGTVGHTINKVAAMWEDTPHSYAPWESC